MDWIRADEARRIATGELSKIMYAIKEAAYKGDYQLILEYHPSMELVEVLNNYGYKISYKQEPIYEETPYGKTNKIESYKNSTIISWR